MSALIFNPISQVYPMKIANWLSKGAKNVPGSIQQPCGKLGFAYIQPDRFPGVRFHFTYPPDWTNNQRHACQQTTLVEFDFPPQDYDPRYNPYATNVRLLGRRVA